MGGFRLVFGPFNHQEGLDEVIAYYGYGLPPDLTSSQDPAFPGDNGVFKFASLLQDGRLHHGWLRFGADTGCQAIQICARVAAGIGVAASYSR